MTKTFIVITIVLVCFFNIWAFSGAAAESSFFRGLNTTAGKQGAGYLIPKEGPDAYIAKILGSFMAPFLVGVMGMLLLAYGGFIWMMSRGREEEVERAKTIIRNTLIALVVIFSAWAIVQLIMPLWELVTGKLSGV